MILDILLTIVAPLVGLGLALLIVVTVDRQHLGADDDWWQPLRRALWPILHVPLTWIGGYALGLVTDEQYVATLDLEEEHAERVLAELGAYRNPVAALKRYREDQVSRGSWVFRSTNSRVSVGPVGFPVPDFFAKYQTHVTLFEAQSGDGTDVFAHRELNPWRHPIKHLRAVHLSQSDGVERVRELFANPPESSFPDGIPYQIQDPTGGTK